MLHLGDITKINGAATPVVDCIIGGSPCQDLSVAGKRAGLAGERSGLFMDQIRLVKEMRARDRANGRTGEFIRPRYMVWENVPGAFSSNKGQDFAAVLEETIRIAEPEAPSIPVPEKGWPTAGVVVGDGWSIAYRVLDAQFWGVPQRRRRIALVADFGGKSAPEILFVREGVSGHTEPCGAEREDSAAGTGTGVEGSGRCIRGNAVNTMDRHAICLNDQGGNIMSVSDDVSATLRAQEHGHQPCVLDMSHANDVIRECDGNAPTLRSRMGTGGNQVPLVYGVGNGQVNQSISEDIAGALNTMHDQQMIMVTGFDAYNQASTGCVSKSLTNAATDSDHIPCVSKAGRIRRLTPLECERLQGFPDFWTDIGTWVDSKGKKHETSDAARYKALGNSIALPPWKWVLKRLCAQYERDAAMASLFDGIGGFQKIWEQLNGEGSCLWASEIEPFCVAVTERRFNNG